MTELLTTKETAGRLQITEGTLMVWRSTKRYPLKFVKIGRKVRYRLSDIEEFLDKRTMSGVPEPARDRKRKAS
jgi:excisionase family DNA binding protein